MRYSNFLQDQDKCGEQSGTKLDKTKHTHPSNTPSALSERDLIGKEGNHQSSTLMTKVIIVSLLSTLKSFISLFALLSVWLLLFLNKKRHDQ